MKIRWIGQSGYVIKTERAEIMLDPYLSDAVNRAAGRPRLLPPPIRPEEAAADAVICTHAHLDHLDTDALKAMPKGQYIITTSEGIGIVRRLGFQKYSVLRTGESVSVKDVKITAVFAKHTVETFGFCSGQRKTVFISAAIRCMTRDFFLSRIIIRIWLFYVSMGSLEI